MLTLKFPGSQYGSLMEKLVSNAGNFLSVLAKGQLDVSDVNVQMQFFDAPCFVIAPVMTVTTLHKTTNSLYSSIFYELVWTFFF